MRSFVISTVIFAILLTLVITNSIYIHKICDKMISSTLDLSQNDLVKANELCKIWKNNRSIFSISIHDSHIERITELTENIKSAATLGNGAEFEKNIFLLTELLEELKQNEEISFQGIL